VKPVRYLEEATEEFLHEVAYFTQVDPRLGQRFDSAVRKAEARASQFPDAWPKYKYGTRRVFPAKFKFSLVYVVKPEEIVVIAVAPFKRKPAYWRSRASAA